MPEPILQPDNNQPNWFASHMVLVSIIIVVIIAAAGAIFWIQTSTPKVVQPDLITHVPKTSTDSTADWKTYTSTQYGFEMKYPATWNLLPDSMAFRSEKNGGVDVFVREDKKDETLEQYLQQADKDSQTAYEGQPAGKVLSTKQVTVAGLPATQRVEEFYAAGFTTIQTYLKKGSQIYTFRLMTEDTSDIPKYTSAEEKVYNQILSTFKFTDSSSVKQTLKIDLDHLDFELGVPYAGDIPALGGLGETSYKWEIVSQKLPDTFRVIVSPYCPADHGSSGPCREVATYMGEPYPGSVGNNYNFTVKLSSGNESVTKTISVSVIDKKK